jgi:hypothetical protein
MKKVLMATAALFACTAAMAAGSHYRSGYVTHNGTYVAPSYATNPNNTKLDNYSTRGNVNPYTGKEGTVDPYKTPKSATPCSAYQADC